MQKLHGSYFTVDPKVHLQHQHSIGYTGDGFYRLQDPTNSIKVLKAHKDYTINRKNTIMTQ